MCVLAALQVSPTPRFDRSQERAFDCAVAHPVIYEGELAVSGDLITGGTRD